jgi:hypothetical protein
MPHRAVAAPALPTDDLGLHTASAHGRYAFVSVQHVAVPDRGPLAGDLTHQPMPAMPLVLLLCNPSVPHAIGAFTALLATALEPHRRL